MAITCTFLGFQLKCHQFPRGSSWSIQLELHPHPPHPPGILYHSSFQPNVASQETFGKVYRHLQLSQPVGGRCINVLEWVETRCAIKQSHNAQHTPNLKALSGSKCHDREAQFNHCASFSLSISSTRIDAVGSSFCWIGAPQELESTGLLSAPPSTPGVPGIIDSQILPPLPLSWESTAKMKMPSLNYTMRVRKQVHFQNENQNVFY